MILPSMNFTNVSGDIIEIQNICVLLDTSPVKGVEVKNVKDFNLTCNLRIKELNLCPKLWIYNPFIFGSQCCRLLIFQTKIIWCIKIHSLKYLKSTTFGCRDIGIRKSEFVSMTQLLCHLRISECDHWRKTKIKMFLIRKIILMWGQLPKK